MSSAVGFQFQEIILKITHFKGQPFIYLHFLGVFGNSQEPTFSYQMPLDTKELR